MITEEHKMRRALKALRLEAPAAVMDDVDAIFEALMARTLRPTGERYRHEKRGTTYDIFGVGHANSSNETKAIFDRDEVVIYRDVQSGDISVRAVPEFLDGRFTLLPPLPGATSVDPAQALATQSGAAPAPAAQPSAAAPQKSPTPAPQPQRVKFRKHGHPKDGLSAEVIDWLESGMIMVRFDGDQDGTVVNNLNLTPES